MKRLKEHLFGASPQTYALNLGKWAPPARALIRVEVVSDMGQEAMQIAPEIERSLWEISRPLLGKRGGR